MVCLANREGGAETKRETRYGNVVFLRHLFYEEGAITRGVLPTCAEGRDAPVLAVTISVSRGRATPAHSLP